MIEAYNHWPGGGDRQNERLMELQARPHRAASRRAPRIFHNSYTRGGRRFVTRGWAVKLQFAGQRRTFSLRAKTKPLAIAEATAISDTLRTSGWEAVMRGHPDSGAHLGGHSGSDPAYWRSRIVPRRHPFPSFGPAHDFAARIDHGGRGYWFPLQTGDPDQAVLRAREIHDDILAAGWEACCRKHSRELIVGFEWCADPILWTYTTVHTLANPATSPASERPGRGPFRRVLIVESDPGICRTLEWCINQTPGFRAFGCHEPGLLAAAVENRRPQLVLLNRQLADQLRFQPGGRILSPRGDLAARCYFVAVDGHHLFTAAPAGADGYLIRRVNAERLLDPILETPAGTQLEPDALSRRVKTYFRNLLQPQTTEPAPGIDRLTRRESEVLALLSKGRVDKEIAQALGISAWTVHGHIKNIFERLQVRTRTEAAARYLENL
jgi:DNA-binding NarL/FixJ family response regulator